MMGITEKDLKEEREKTLEILAKVATARDAAGEIEREYLYFDATELGIMEKALCNHISRIGSRIKQLKLLTNQKE